VSCVRALPTVSRALKVPVVALLTALAAGLVLLAGASARPAATGHDWPRFSSVGAASAGITAGNVGRLRHQVVTLDGTVDSALIYLHHVSVHGRPHDVFFFTTTYGKTEALDASTGKLLWRYVPASYGTYAGSPQITVMTPVADPGRKAIYAGEPDGKIVKLAVSTGKLLWATAITRDPTHEKLAGSLNFSRGLVLAATDGYIGDAPPYQGHVVSLSPASGHIVGVWNSLCSDRHTIILPSTCGGSDSAIWGRSAPVVDPATGDILVAMGNGPFDGKTNWGDSVAVLSPDAKKMLKHWTPTNQQQLDDADLDLGSTAPALLAGGYFVQGGKDGELRLLSLSKLAGVNPTTGGELQTVNVPGPTDLFSEPAVWKGTWVFLSDYAGTAAWQLRGGRLHPVWSNGNAGTSPVVAGGLLYIDGPGGIHVYVPATGKELTVLPGGDVHWESPIVADGRVAAPEGNSNDHALSGVLDIYRTP
jgi:outer membrane protein assembly factor BamB